LGKTKISYSAENFDTVFGPLQTDRAFVQKLAAVPNTSAADFFYREHGIGAQLPFVKYFFPNAKIVVIDLSVYSQPKDLKGLIDFLGKNLGQKTLLIQSTDFSHYLPAATADLMDQQTMGLLDKISRGADPDILYQLKEPDNLDCVPCQYLQSVLQKDFYKTQAHIFDHKNSQDYTQKTLSQTTSYLPQIYY
jgi:poly-gamma-glutamate synthesis protein (capsule biosynthesis protein)